MMANIFRRALARKSRSRIELDAGFTTFLQELADEVAPSSDFITTISFGMIMQSDEEMPFHAAVAILLARHHHPRARLLLFCEIEPRGEHWNIVRDHVRWCPVPAFDRLEHRLAQQPSGRMLLVRLLALKVLGGMFASTDMFILRPMDDLARHDMVLGIQASAPVSRFAFGAELAMASANNTFSQAWLDACLADTASSLYDLACRLPVRLYAQAPESAYILSHTAWFSPVKQKIDHFLFCHDPDQALQLCSDSLALPLWNDVLNERLAGWKSGKSAQSDCLFARLVHSVLPQATDLDKASDSVALPSGAA